jgi:succinate dehydrogenase / fumarate reductase cytochrome b subunit
MWSWLFHRVSGLGILLFLFVHIVDVSLLGFGPTIYNNGIALFDSVIVRLLSLSLFAAVFYHAFNGIRIMLVDFWSKGARYQQVMFTIVMVVTIICFIPIVYFVIGPVVPGMVAWFFSPLTTASVGH